MKYMVWLTALTLPLAAADPPGFALWSGKQLKSYEKSLAPKMNPIKYAGEQLAQYGNHLLMVSHREGTGQSEIHETQADIFVVQSGEATLVVGGTLVDGKTTAPHEIRGASIKNGEKKKLAAGDVVHIPARTPHWLMLEPGKQFTYMIVKIDVQ